MQYEEILTHPYYDKLKEMFYRDDPGTEIENWVKNTVNEDPAIPEDKRKDYYLSSRKINAYKKLLQEQTRAMSVELAVPRAVVATDPIPTTDVQVKTDTVKPVQEIVKIDTERNLVRMKETMGMLFVTAQERFIELLTASRERGFTDPAEEKNIRGYLVEIRNLCALYAKLTGQEDFMRVVASGAGQKVLDGTLSPAQKQKLRDYVRNLLAAVSPEEIPTKLAELEEILSGEAE